jgi:hypothetical protein
MSLLKTHTQLDYSRIKSGGRDCDSDSSKPGKRQSTTTIAATATAIVLKKA